MSATPCGHSTETAHQLAMENNATPDTAPVDKSVYGLVVFLVIFVFFASLTSGLLVCLTKIWCGFRTRPCTNNNPQLSDKQRRSILHSPVFVGETDSEDESAQQTLASRRFSHRIMSYVQRSLLDEKKPDRKESVTAGNRRSSRSCRGSSGAADLRRLPTITTEPPDDAPFPFIPPSPPRLLPGTSHDPSTIVHV